VFEDTPALLGRAIAVAERLDRLLEEDNLAAIGGTLRNLETFTATLATRSAEIDALLGGRATSPCRSRRSRPRAGH
jgi:ABC-type transporter Mla subunit MlaD